MLMVTEKDHIPIRMKMDIFELFFIQLEKLDSRQLVMEFPRHHRKFLHNQSTNHCLNIIHLIIVHHQEHIIPSIEHRFLKILLFIKLVQCILHDRRFLLMLHSLHHRHDLELPTSQNTNRNTNKKFIDQNMYLSLNINRKIINNNGTNMYLNQQQLHRHLLLLNIMKKQLQLHDDFIHQENWISPGHLMASHTRSTKAKFRGESQTFYCEAFDWNVDYL